jgi:ribonuclease HI
MTITSFSLIILKCSLAGLGGAIYSPRGSIVYTYAWSLRTMSNNLAEAYALLQGLILAMGLGLSNHCVIGDYSIIIKHMIMGSLSSNF